MASRILVCVPGTRKAAKGARAKWARIKRGAYDMGTGNCPLCAIFFQQEGGGHCLGCPVVKATRRKDCMGTPYEAWADHQKNAHPRRGTDADWRPWKYKIKKGCKECKRLAKAEHAYLVGVGKRIVEKG